MNLSSPRTYVSLLLGMVVFAFYLSTMAPVVYSGDSGELTVAAFSLGIPHNSGYPLYCLLGKIFCMIPLGNIGFRMNLMSAFFSMITVCFVYTIILRMTSSVLPSLVASSFLAFTPVFWSQTVSAEVYPLHTFFVALMIRLLLWWDENRQYFSLLLFVFITGLSFGNHMQTLMLAPPVLYLVISGDKKRFFNLKLFTLISLCFVAALSLYLYLPIRTDAGAAIHWGDPNNLERFIAHVTARAHRGGYVFSGIPAEYAARALKALIGVTTQFGVLLLLILWGWFKLPSARWKIFFAGAIFFDLIYTIFLNVISFQITPFTLSTSIILSVLLGDGMADVFDVIRQQPKISSNLKKTVKVAFCLIPAIPLTFNFSLCDQSRNYTAYEHAVNIFRTAGYGSTIFLDGDNNIFPAAYGRIVEGMGGGIILQDRPNTIFRWSLPEAPLRSVGKRDDFKSIVHKSIVSEGEKRGVYFAVFNPYAVTIPNAFQLSPYGILRKVVADRHPGGSGDADNVWAYYSTESFYDDFERDYMTREVCAFYFFRKGESLCLSGKVAEGLKQLRKASRIGYDDTTIHSDIAVFLTDMGLFDEARKELEKALLYHDELSGIYNNWGYYYHKTGDYQRAVASFRKAIELSPRNYTYHNNLGLIFHGAGKKEEARLSFKRSLSMNQDQPKVKEFMETHSLR